MPRAAEPPVETWSLKLLFDGECPFCRREVAWLQRRDRAGRLAFEDITAPGFDAARYGATRAQLMGVIHGVLPEGRLVRRLDVLRIAYRAVGLGALVAPTGWPLVRPVADRLYLLFARHRVRLGRWLGRTCAAGCDVQGRAP